MIIKSIVSFFAEFHWEPLSW